VLSVGFNVFGRSTSSSSYHHGIRHRGRKLPCAVKTTSNVKLTELN